MYGMQPCTHPPIPTPPADELAALSYLPRCRPQDFLATIDLNKNSPTYKQIIQYTPIGSIGNEPHREWACVHRCCGSSCLLPVYLQ